LIGLLAARPRDRCLDRLPIVPHDPKGFRFVAQARPFPLVELPAPELAWRLDGCCRLPQLLTVGCQPVVHHPAFDDDSADVPLAETLGDELHNRVPRPLQPARREVGGVEDEEPNLRRTRR
jgi:hypothetical protein